MEIYRDDEIDNATQETIVLSGGTAEYDLTRAACPIEELIASLEEAREEGATHVVLSSGNHRGASWARLSSNYRWLGE